MATHVFVDESKGRGLLVAAAVCAADDTPTHRKALRALLLPGQERLHFNHERPRRRNQIVDVIAGFGVRVCLYRAERDDAAGRSACLRAVIRDNAGSAHRVVIERDESTYDFDRRTLKDAVGAYGCRDTLRWDLLAPKQDPMLWLPDAVAWCWARGGTWRHAVRQFCELIEP